MTTDRVPIYGVLTGKNKVPIDRVPIGQRDNTQSVNMTGNSVRRTGFLQTECHQGRASRRSANRQNAKGSFLIEKATKFGN